MYFFDSIFHFVSQINTPVRVTGAAACATILCNIILKVFEMLWNRNAKDFNEILDVHNKLDKKNQKIKELVELHKAKFLIQKEAWQEYTYKRYHQRDGIYIKGLKYRLLKALIVIPVIIFLILNSFDSSGFNFARIIMPSIFAMIVFISFGKLWDAASFVLFRTPRNTTLCKVEFQRPYNTETQKKKQKEYSKIQGSIRVLRKQSERVVYSNTDDQVIYDYIGLPSYTGIDLYKKSSEKPYSDETIVYLYESSRKMTMLEIEWATRLNKLGGIFIKTSHYVPFVKDNGVHTHSAYFLVIEEA